MRSIFVFILLVMVSLSGKAFAQQWGSGVYGMNQSCPYGGMGGMGMQQGQQQPLEPEVDTKLIRLQRHQRDARQDKRDAEKKLRELEDKKTAYADALSNALKSDWADAVTDHLENGGECGCQDQAVPGDQPPQEIPTVDPPPRPWHHDHGGSPTVSDAKEIATARAPASEAENQYDKAWADSSSGQGFNGCDALHGSRPWKAICTRGGVTKNVCHNRYFANEGTTGGEAIRACDEAIANYKKVSQEAELARAEVKKSDELIASIKTEIRDHEREERDDPDGGRHKHGDGNSGPSMLTSLLPLAAGVIGGLGAEYLGYKANQANNTNLNKLGYPTQSYQFGSYGFPFFQAGIYGSLAAGQQGSFGCSSGYGGMQNSMMGQSPYGMSPYGMNPYATTAPGYSGLNMFSTNYQSQSMMQPYSALNFRLNQYYATPSTVGR